LRLSGLVRPSPFWSTSTSVSIRTVLPHLLRYSPVLPPLLVDTTASYFCNLVFLYLGKKPLIFTWSLCFVGDLYRYIRQVTKCRLILINLIFSNYDSYR
jgi:hypothetical protein